MLLIWEKYKRNFLSLKKILKVKGSCNKEQNNRCSKLFFNIIGSLKVIVPIKNLVLASGK